MTLRLSSLCSFHTALELGHERGRGFFFHTSISDPPETNLVLGVGILEPRVKIKAPQMPVGD